MRELARALRAIAFRDDQLWTEQRAQAWWAAHRLLRSEHPTSDAPRDLAVAATITSS